MKLHLRNVTWFEGEERKCEEILISENFLDRISGGATLEIDAGNFFMYPGLINAHDHLEMNLYPRLGTPPYENYVQWANDIYKPNESPVKEIEQVPIADRLMWGGLKNLIAGVSRVAHHNPWHRLLGTRNYPVRVLSEFSWAHSLAFEKKIKRQAGRPFFIHAAEGIDEFAEKEIDTLDAMKLLDEHTVLIHAVGVNADQISKLATARTSVVWCPASNLYMFGRTAPISALKSRVQLGLGSDSTLTGSPHFLGELSVALHTGQLTRTEIFNMVTAPQLFLRVSPSIVKPDFFIARKKTAHYHDNLFMIKPEDIVFAFNRGKIRLTDDDFTGKALLPHKFKVNGIDKQTYFDVQALRYRIKKKAGAEILDRNELWRSIG